MSQQPEKSKPRERLYVSFVRPRCPTCGSVHLRAYKTCNNGDATLTRYSHCLDCREKIILIVE